jgi:hypothetical protein
MAPPDTLHFALGVGSPPNCDADEPIVETENNVSVEGSHRQSAIDSNGTISITWVEQDAVTGNYALMVQRVLGPGSPTAVYVSRNVLRHPTLAVDALNRIHMAVVRENSPTSHTVVRLKLDEGLGIEEMDEWGGVWEHYRPVIAITGESTVHLVFETRSTTDPYSGSRIEHVMVEGTNSHHTSFVRDWLPREPDVVAIGNHLLMVYVEDHSGPWYAMLMSQLCRPGFPPDWQEPEVLDTADQVTSPSVAWDGAGRLLFAWISDNSAATGEPAKVLSLDWENQTFGEVRARPGQAQHHAVSVASTGPGQFAMLTLESEGGPDMGVWLRQGDGRCFFPRVQLNTTSRDVSTPLLAASPISGERLVHWQDYEMAFSRVRGAYCAGGATGVLDGRVPIVFSRQLSCRPNPSNPSATLFFDLWEAGRARLVIYDARGRLVRTLLDAELPARAHEIVWDGRDDRGVQLSSGVYFARLIRPGGDSSIAKLALVK